MDTSGLSPKGIHPDRQERLPDSSGDAKPLRRCKTQKPVRFYYADFGISTWFSEGEAGEKKSEAALRKKRLVKGRLGLLQTVPELSDDDPYDPFGVDVFILGTLLWNTFVAVSAPCLTSRLIV
jgi:hypothetical protein